MPKTIQNAQLVHAGGIQPDMSIELADGKITRLYPSGTQIPVGEAIDAAGQYVSAGFIDIHVHGGGNGDFNDGLIDSYEKALACHMLHGTTALCPTIVAAQTQELAEAAATYKAILPRCGTELPALLGFHLEGPFIAPAQAGALDPRYISAPTEACCREIVRACDGLLRIWTMAPELANVTDLAPMLLAEGILLSAGHTDARYADMEHAVEAGFTMTTHLYSAMSAFIRVEGRRVPGAIESTMILDNLLAEVIADGHHLPKELLKLIVRAKGTDKLILVTDAMRAAGMPPGEYVLGSLRDGTLAPVDEDVAHTPDGKAFAGSIATADRLIRVMRDQAGVSLPEAVKMLTVNPARAIGIDAHKGTLAPGMDADVVMFDEDIQIKGVWVGGNRTVTA